MKITFAGTTLADDAALLWCDGDQLDASRETVADDLPGAAYQGRRDLGNATVEYGFSASKEHASIREAEVYYLTHGQGVIGQGEAVLSTVQSKAIRYMRDAILSATGISLRGVTTVFEYTLLGAAMTGLLAGGLGSTSTLNSPAIAAQAVPSIAVSALASSSSLAAPALADAGAESMAAGGLASSSTLQSPGLSEQSSDTLNVGPLASSSSLSAPALTEIPSIDAGGLASVSTLSAPTLSPQSNDSLAAGGLASTSSLSAPGVAEAPSVDFLLFEDSTDILSTPDSSENSPVGAIDLIARISVSDWTPGSNDAIISKDGTSTESSFSLQLRSDGIYLFTTANGSTFASGKSNSVSSLSVDTPIWIRATFDPSSTYTFEYSTEDIATPPSSWTNIGVATTSSSAASLKDSTAAITIGNRPALDRPFDGKIYYAELKDGIGGTLVAKFDAADGTDPTYNNVAGQTVWTNSGATPGND